MNMVYASTYLYLPEFLSLVSYNFLSTRSFTSLFEFIPRYFILFEAIVNCLLVSLSDSLLLVYKNATGFWIFILYPATLLNFSLLVAFCGIFRVLYVQYHGYVTILQLRLRIPNPPE